MIRPVVLIGLLVCTALPINGEEISLSGTVKKTGAAAGLAGVKVSLANISSLSATTNAEGKFTITGTTAVQSLQRETPSFQFNLKGKSIVLSPASREVKGRIDIFSSNGKKVFSTELASGQESRRTIDLPELSSGINVMQITVGTTSLTRTLVRIGNELFLNDAASDMSAAGNLLLNKQAAAAAVDTLIASKSGFTTKKVPIDAYAKSNITIEMDSSGGTGGKCTRESLQELVNGYLAALEAGDPTKMVLADGAKYIADMKSSSFDKGMWTAKPKVSFHRDFLDVDSCSAYVEMFDSINTHAYNIGAQIRTANGKITEISALVGDEGDWAISGRADIAKMVRISSGEKWPMIPAAQQNDRATIKAAGDAYLDIFKDKSVQVPWGTPCARLEGSMYTGNANNPGGSSGTCDVGIPDNLSITDRHYIVDVDMGSVDIFCKFGGGMPDSHLFRVENGKLRYVHTISIQN
ncbi:MAG: hypothetical protein JW863_23505 [Chitinispirillaceae bacterium]|nr:hypothetical protein [Chitinispirillaceae bacterium]